MNACGRLARLAFRFGGDPEESVALIDRARVAQARALRAAGGGSAREAISDVVAAAHRAIDRVGAVAWSPFLAEQETWLADVAR